jgi:hypothetical protein
MVSAISFCRFAQGISRLGAGWESSPGTIPCCYDLQAKWRERFDLEVKLVARKALRAVESLICGHRSIVRNQPTPTCEPIGWSMTTTEANPKERSHSIG